MAHVVWSAERAWAVIVELRAGHSRRRACESVGIGKTTFYRWMRERPDFHHEVVQARVARIKAIDAALPPDWGAKVAKARAMLADTDVRVPDVVSAPSDDRT